MISVIICSRSQFSNDKKINIEETIGVNYEIILIDNSENSYSIFEAYNIGIKKSKGDYLCFMHDDVFMHSNNWGVILQNIFNKDPQIGLIGVAGSRVKSKMPSAWWDCKEEEFQINIIQHYKNEDKRKLDFGFKENSCVEVAAIDGVFMVMKKQNNISFNEKLSGFHNYDLNLSFEHFKKGLKVVVTNEILLEHFSIGKLNKSWYKSTYKIHQLYSDILPIYKTYSSQKNKQLEYKNGTDFIYNAIQMKQFIIAFKSWLLFFFTFPFSIYHFKLIKRILFK